MIVWDNRYLLGFLVLRDIKVRYKQAFMGIAWAVITPLLQVITFAFIFGGIFRLSTGQTNYFPLVLVGFTFWNFLSQSINSSLVALTSNADLITKVKFPKMILVLSAIIGRLPDLVVTLVVLFGILFFMQPIFIPNIPVFLGLFTVEMVLVLGISLILAVTNVYFRDIVAIIPTLMTLWLFLTPVVYPLTSVPEKYKLIALFNPAAGILEGMRQVLVYNKMPDVNLTIIASVVSTAILIFGIVYFKKLEKYLPDII